MRPIKIHLFHYKPLGDALGFSYCGKKIRTVVLADFYSHIVKGSDVCQRCKVSYFLELARRRAVAEQKRQAMLLPSVRAYHSLSPEFQAVIERARHEVS